ncbi:hypothetical protein A1O1_06734 [Capronia coronata CBS 617.96]|uniref:BRCT domain-containing protein n=1 Tax=Capronia coronata CBS 617.96 TaxID=1182541 RepID=W9Y0F7_9EURO|nr:uncharacterized protein A1O1_06734 [Capronia coronata CBS 617.96]EXJ83115.1 hypothetical protein A1O1_06734 [Capronia coronata CBS 617.96]
MRPPPLPLVSGFGADEPEEGDSPGFMHEEKGNSSTASPSPAATPAFGSSPSSTKPGDQSGICTESSKPSKEPPSRSPSADATEEAIISRDKNDMIKSQEDSQPDGAEKSPELEYSTHLDKVGSPGLSVASPRERNIPEENACPAGDTPSPTSSTVPAVDTPDSSLDLASDISEERTKKRKLIEMEETDLDLDSMLAQSASTHEDELHGTIVVTPHSRPEDIVLTPKDLRSRSTSLRPQRRVSGENISNRQQLLEDPQAQPVESSPSGVDIDKGPVVIFSNTNIHEKKTVMRSFISIGGHITTSINKATVLVIGDGPLKKTGKFIMAVAMGLQVVTKQWILTSIEKRQFQDIREFIPNDPSREREWGFGLEQAIAQGKQGLTHLLAGTTVIFTRQLKTDLGKSLERELSQVATILGAEAVKHRLPALKDKGNYQGNELLIIGAPHDPQGAHVGRLGHKLFSKDILTMGALRGEIDRDSGEFSLEVPLKAEESD